MRPIMKLKLEGFRCQLTSCQNHKKSNLQLATLVIYCIAIHLKLNFTVN